MKISSSLLWSAAVMTALFLAAIAFRPLLPVDETRYMTVAWEMRLHHGWFSPLTLNFEPYSHKPPLLFWLINIFWSIFGVNRWGGLVPVILASFTVVLLTVALGKKLLPQDMTADKDMRVTFLMLGSVPFLIYNTLVLFDLTLTVFVLCALLCLLEYAKTRKFRYMALLGFSLGLGVLTKGPVAYLYVLFPLLLAPLWVENFTQPRLWYRDCIGALGLSLLPVAVWLIPVLSSSDHEFAFWLLWNQTAGRVTGNFQDAHIRPIYFYLPLLPLIFAPWIALPSFWRNIKNLDTKNSALRFLACWLIPVFVSFSVISGKQPHYLVPLIPGVILLMMHLLKSVKTSTLRNVTIAMVTLTIGLQAIASHTYLDKYNLIPVATAVALHPENDWAFVRNYHGEIGFLAKLEKHIDSIDLKDVGPWFKKHPNGMVVIRYDTLDEVLPYQEISSSAYRGKRIGIFTVKEP